MRLRAEIAAARDRRTEFGTHDCLQFAARCVLAMTGEDYGSRFPAYTSAAGARSVLDTHGGVAGILTSCIGEPISPNHAHIGDVVIARFRPRDGLDSPDGEDAAGICLGAHLVFCGRPRGVAYRPRGAIRLAWRIA